MGIDLHHPGKGQAALNLYSTRPGFRRCGRDRGAVRVACRRWCSAMLDGQRAFQTGAEQPQDIGQALGIVMERYGIDEDRAFQFMVRVSQDSNVKVREVAADIVAGVNRRNHPK